MGSVITWQRLCLCRRPKRPCPLVVPAMMAAFLDENLPDGTRLRPGTKFIKYWKMRNTGTVSWNADTKVNDDGPQDHRHNAVLAAHRDIVPPKIRKIR